MALTKEQIATDYPLPVYNYRVNIADTTIAFSEVSGLDIGFDPITYKESQVADGKAGPNIMYMPGMITEVNITLKKGLVKAKSVPVLYEWINSTALNRIDKRDITVSLCDETGTPVVTWKVIDAFPTKLTAPTFDANSNEVAVEQMELRASSVSMEEN
ncbi:MAG: phage tail protein [Bacteroidota bacterium]